MIDTATPPTISCNMWAVHAASYCGIIDFIVSRHASKAQADADMRHQIATNGAEQISTRGARWFYRVEQIGN